MTGYLTTVQAAQGIMYTAGAFGVDVDQNSDPGPFTASGTSVLSDVSYPTAENGTNATIAENGLTPAVPKQLSGDSVYATSTFELGARTSGAATPPCDTDGCAKRLFSGQIDEMLFYNAPLTLTSMNISTIRSYLAIKYGITLGFNVKTLAVTGTDYFSRASTTKPVWSGASNATFAHNVAGIGQDAYSGLDQRLSHSINSGAFGNLLDVTIANGPSISTLSQVANTKFGSDGYVVWGDNNLGTAMSSTSGVYRMSRVWRTQVTGTGSTQIMIQVPQSAFAGISNPTILVASDANFQTGLSTTALVCAANLCKATVPTFSSASTQYFSFGALVTLSGTIFEDINYGGGAGRSLSTCSGSGLSGATVQLYSAAGAFLSSTTTSGAGTYAFAEGLDATYTVRVVTPTTSTRIGGTTSGIMPVQTSTITPRTIREAFRSQSAFSDWVALPRAANQRPGPPD